MGGRHSNGQAAVRGAALRGAMRRGAQRARLPRTRRPPTAAYGRLRPQIRPSAMPHLPAAVPQRAAHLVASCRANLELSGVGWGHCNTDSKGSCAVCTFSVPHATAGQTGRPPRRGAHTPASAKARVPSRVGARAGTGGVHVPGPPPPPPLPQAAARNARMLPAAATRLPSQVPPAQPRLRPTAPQTRPNRRQPMVCFVYMAAALTAPSRMLRSPAPGGLRGRA